MTYLSTAEVAERLGLTRRHVSRLVASGELSPAAQAPGPNGAFLFDPAEVDRAVEARADRKAGKVTA